MSTTNPIFKLPWNEWFITYGWKTYLILLIFMFAIFLALKFRYEDYKTKEYKKNRIIFWLSVIIYGFIFIGTIWFTIVIEFLHGVLFIFVFINMLYYYSKRLIKRFRKVKA